MSPAGKMWNTNLCSSLKDNPGTNNKSEISRVAQNSFPILGQMWLLTTGPVVDMAALFAEACLMTKTAGVSSRICTVTKSRS